LNRQDDEGRDLQDVLARADAELGNLDPTPFSNEAFEDVKRNIYVYVAALVTESIKTARRSGLDTVSTVHVERAAGYLMSGRPRRLYRNMETLGGLLLGAALSTLLAFTLTENLDALAVILTTVVGLVGMGLLTYGIASGE
jgi:hypothetical protein